MKTWNSASECGLNLQLVSRAYNVKREERGNEGLPRETLKGTEAPALVPWITWSGVKLPGLIDTLLWRDSQGELKSSETTSIRKDTTLEDDCNLILWFQHKKRPQSWTPTPAHRERETSFCCWLQSLDLRVICTLPAGDQTSSVSLGLTSKSCITCCPFLIFLHRYHFSLGNYCHRQSKGKCH